jgi:hypothetical protein
MDMAREVQELEGRGCKPRQDSDAAPHYTASGAVKEQYLTIPDYDFKFLQEFLRAAEDVCDKTVFGNRNQIKMYDPIRMVWRAKGCMSISIRNVEPEDIDEELAAMPKQQELF